MGQLNKTTGFSFSVLWVRFFEDFAKQAPAKKTPAYSSLRHKPHHMLCSSVGSLRLKFGQKGFEPAVATPFIHLTAAGGILQEAEAAWRGAGA